METKDLETVLYEFALEPEQTRQTLEAYALRYPDYVEELADLAFELRLTHAAELDTPEQPKDLTGQSAWSEFISSGSPSESRSVRATLASHFRGPAFVDLSAKLDMPHPIIEALRDRIIEPATIPGAIVLRIAAITSINEREIRQYFDQPSQHLQAAEIRVGSDDHGRERMSFAQLVAETPMSDDERRRLLI
jgi:hypothetical protein